MILHVGYQLWLWWCTMRCWHSSCIILKPFTYLFLHQHNKIHSQIPHHQAFWPSCILSEISFRTLHRIYILWLKMSALVYESVLGSFNIPYSPGRYMSAGISEQTALSWAGITQFWCALWLFIPALSLQLYTLIRKSPSVHCGEIDSLQL